MMSWCVEARLNSHKPSGAEHVRARKPPRASLHPFAPSATAKQAGGRLSRPLTRKRRSVAHGHGSVRDVPAGLEAGEEQRLGARTRRSTGPGGRAAAHPSAVAAGKRRLFYGRASGALDIAILVIEHLSCGRLQGSKPGVRRGSRVVLSHRWRSRAIPHPPVPWRCWNAKSLSASSFAVALPGFLARVPLNLTGGGATEAALSRLGTCVESSCRRFWAA